MNFGIEIQVNSLIFNVFLWIAIFILQLKHEWHDYILNIAHFSTWKDPLKFSNTVLNWSIWRLKSHLRTHLQQAGKFSHYARKFTAGAGEKKLSEFPLWFQVHGNKKEFSLHTPHIPKIDILHKTIVNGLGPFLMAF